MRVGTALRVVAAVAGVALFGVAARYAVIRNVQVRPPVWIEWWVTAALLHDLVVAPAAVAVGWVVVRFAPRPAKAPLQSALLLSAIVLAISLPALRGYGRVASNPTYLPRDYGTGLALTLGAVWLACAGWAAARVVRRPAAPLEETAAADARRGPAGPPEEADAKDAA